MQLHAQRRTRNGERAAANKMQQHTKQYQNRNKSLKINEILKITLILVSFAH
jgi:hypothetical protein